LVNFCFPLLSKAYKNRRSTRLLQLQDDFDDDKVQADSDNNDVDYKDSVASLKAEVLSTSYAGDASFSSEMNIGDDNIVTPLSLYEEHKKSFYCMYTPMWETVKSTTHLITDEKYAWIQSVLQAKPHKKDTMNMRKV
jgi:hypothetical protein